MSDLQSLNALRTQARRFFDELEVTLFRVDDVATSATSSLALAHRYYGDEAITRADNLLALNPTIANPAYIPAGTVRVLRR